MSDNTANRIMLFDAYSQIFRAFYAIRYLSDPSGNPVNALFVFTKLLLELERKYPSRYGAMLFDCGKVDFRLKLNPDYKANRPPMPDDLKKQIPLIREMASAFGWPQYAVTNFEADDLIGGIVAASPGREIRIVTSDKDLSQLVTDDVKLVAPAGAKQGGFEERGTDEVYAKFGVPPQLISDYLALVGDSSDNIPGIPGIGPKGAAEMLQKCGGIEKYLADKTLLAGSKFEKKLAGQDEFLKCNLQLVRLKTELPPELSDLPAALERAETDWAKIREICEKHGFKSIVRDLPEVDDVPAEEKENRVVDDDLFSGFFDCRCEEKSDETETISAKESMEQGELF